MINNKLPYEIILNEFGWLADLYALDYFVEQHWHKLPHSWQKHFDKCILYCKKNYSNNLLLQMFNFVKALLNSNECFFISKCGPFPLSLISLKKCVSLLSINRIQFKNKCQIENKLFQCCKVREKK